MYIVYGFVLAMVFIGIGVACSIREIKKEIDETQALLDKNNK